jgi:uncharacterized protein YciI
MAVFAVQYVYTDDVEQVNAIRPIHREWLQHLLDQGDLLASGPMVDYPAALLIFKSESQETMSALLDQDPFDIAGVIVEREVREWNPVFGPFN